MPDFKTFKHSVGLLVSSPKAQVFYHADVPGQALWQLRGKKRIYIYPAELPFLEPRELENVVRGITEEEVTYKSWYDDYARAYDLEAGDMLHWKLNGPHRVVNLGTVNVSLTTEHWTTDNPPQLRDELRQRHSAAAWLPAEVAQHPRSRLLGQGRPHRRLALVGNAEEAVLRLELQVPHRPVARRRSGSVENV